jgi:multiple antibiotic resistance protein
MSGNWYFNGMTEFWLCFIPLFVAVDAIGVLPVFVSLTDGMEQKQVRRVVLESVCTALAVALTFLVAGPALLRFLGISVADFMIAGGLLLLAISLTDILSGPRVQRNVDLESVGAVPIGIPLITGPAVLTTGMLLVSTYGVPLTAAALLVNVILVGLTFLFADSITRRLGRTGTKAISKLASLFLAAIAVMLMRKGIVLAIATAGH